MVKACQECVAYLTPTTQDHDYNDLYKAASSFTQRIDMGGLKYPSMDVFSIICSAEAFFVREQKDINATKNFAEKMAQKFLAEFTELDALKNVPQCHRETLSEKLLSTFFMCRIRKALRDAYQSTKSKANVDYAGKTALMKSLINKRPNKCIQPAITGK